MSKKLLSEAQVRRFQSLANISSLQEMGNYSMKRNDEKEKMEEDAFEEANYKKDDAIEEMYHDKEEKKMEEEMEMDADMDDDDMEMDADMDDDEQVDLEQDVLEDAVAAMSKIQALIDALGGEAADMGADDEDMPMPGADEPPAMDDDEPADEPSPLEEEEDILELALEGIQYEPSQKEIVQEVAKRVARRLQEAKKAHATLNKALGNK